jgi:hypothetical protein
VRGFTHRKANAICRERLGSAESCYAIQAGLYQRTRRRAQPGDPRAKEWVDAYLQLSELLRIRVPEAAIKLAS